MTCASSVPEAGHSKLMLWDNPEGWNGERQGSGGLRQGTHVYPLLTHVDVCQKPPQYYSHYPPIKIDLKKRI